MATEKIEGAKRKAKEPITKKISGLKAAISKALEKAKKEKGLSVQAVAKAAGLSPYIISNMRYGATSTITQDVALSLARVTGIDANIFQPFLDANQRRRPNKGSRRKAQKKSDVMVIPCPHCGGEGQIKVRKI